MKLIFFVLFALFCVAPFHVQGRAEPSGGTRTAATISQAGTLWNVLGDTFGSSYKEEGDTICYWNDWRDRDRRAEIEGTWACRYSRPKKIIFGIVNGRWYCTKKRGTC
eukprot:TRINITY_DN12720_c0_g1_i1.p1 TRINITY_DN12720_c0_g1~~TRINITY_DN12720_c0_g1_i1.p1  ORF type:complete len:108 (+),score=12.37 TRINITY_DN12720_c0_g1_i1:75-398(+)